MIAPENFPEKQVQVLKDIYQICLGIKSNKDEYINTNKAHTTIGAAIFYGPHNREVQCQGTSLESIRTNEKVEDHVYSRNQSGKFFMDHDFSSFEEFFDWYWTKASIFVYVTKEQNRQLKPFQMENYMADWKETYRKAGVELISEI